MSLNGLVGPRGNDLSSDGANQLIQFKEVLHSSVGEWCVIFELRGLFPNCFCNLGHSLLESDLFPHLREREQLFLTHFHTLSNISISPSFIASKIESLVFVPMVSGTSWENWLSSCTIRATQWESYDEIPLTCKLYSTYPVAVELCFNARWQIRFFTSYEKCVFLVFQMCFSGFPILWLLRPGCVLLLGELLWDSTQVLC